MRGTGLMLLLLLASPAAAPESRVDRFNLTLDNGRTLAVELRLPNGTTGPVPALMLFGGFQRGGKVLELVPSADKVAWASFEYPYEPPRKFRFPGSLKHAPEMRDAIHGSFEGVAKLHAALKQRPEIDPKRITVVGASAGAPLALVGAARAGIPGVILVQGFADVPMVVQHLLERKARNRYGGWVATPARWMANWLNWYCQIPDIAAQARTLKAGQKVLLVTAQDDDYIPRAASDALWAALQESGADAQRMMQPGQHLRADREGEVDKILNPAMEWMKRQDLI